MTVTRRNYIFGAFLSSVLCVVFTIVAISSNSWVVSTATNEFLANDGWINYGLFRGEIVVSEFGITEIVSFYMTCVGEVNACALSCKTEKEARIIEVRAMAQGYLAYPDCGPTTEVFESVLLDPPPVISFALYVCLVSVLFFKLALDVTAAVLAIINAMKNPTKPMFGLPGCLWTNVATAILGIIALIMFGAYWSASALQDHLAMLFIALGLFVPGPNLGFSYWMLLGAVLCPIVNIGLIQVRANLLEKDPPPQTIKLEPRSNI